MAEIIGDALLETVTGGANSIKAIKFYSYGKYWGDSDKKTGPYTDKCACAGLSVEYKEPKAAAPYCVYLNGIAIGWTMDSQFYYL